MSPLHSTRVRERSTSLGTPRRSPMAMFAIALMPASLQLPPQCSRRTALAGLGASLALRGQPAHAAEVDPEYPGTAVERMRVARDRAASLSSQELSGDWESAVRPRLLWAAGLRDLREAAPGAGYTGHAFNDAIHVDPAAAQERQMLAPRRPA